MLKREPSRTKREDFLLRKASSASQLKNLVRSGKDTGTESLWTSSRPISASTSSRDNIKVFVRVRPTSEKEEEFEETVSVIGKSTLILKRGQSSRHEMKFDHVFPKEATQEDVYSVLREYVVIPCLSGFNSTIFAYGQTGAGKTFTILGDEKSITNLSLNSSEKILDSEKSTFLMNRGLIPRIVEHILKHIEQTKEQMLYNLYCSYLEIYSEKIYDLLVRSNHEMPLDIRQDKHTGVYVKDLTTIQVTKAADIYELLECGASNRSIRSTESNERSSRSHTIFQLLIEQEPRHMEGIRKISKLNVVDLAGSERWTSMGNGFADPERIAEMTSINSSLATLGNCINALSQKGRNHIPYRDSKLTRLLQDSLGGNNKTVFISNISPSLLHHDETFSTLRFAERANRIHFNATINEVVDDKVLIQRYEKEIDRLRSELKKKTEKANEEILEENRKLLEDNQKLVNYLKGVGHIEKAMTHTHNQSEKLSSFTTAMLERIEKDQQSREEELARYHSWLQSIPIIEEDGEHAIEMKAKLTLMQRTIQIKQEEIERTKKLSHRDFLILQNDINEKSQEIDIQTQQIHLLLQQVQVLQSKLNLASGESPSSIVPTLNEENEGKELLELLAKYEERKDKLVGQQKIGFETFTKRLSLVLEEYITDEILPRVKSNQKFTGNEIREELNGILEGCCDALVSGILSRQSDFVSHTHLLLRRMHDVTVSLTIRSRKERFDALKKLKHVTKLLRKDRGAIHASIQTDDAEEIKDAMLHEQLKEHGQKILVDLNWLNDIQSSTFSTLTTLRNYAQQLGVYFDQISKNSETGELPISQKRLHALLEQLNLDFSYIESQFTETCTSLDRLKALVSNSTKLDMKHLQSMSPSNADAFKVHVHDYYIQDDNPVSSSELISVHNSDVPTKSTESHPEVQTSSKETHTKITNHDIPTEIKAITNPTMVPHLLGSPLASIASYRSPQKDNDEEHFQHGDIQELQPSPIVYNESSENRQQLIADHNSALEHQTRTQLGRTTSKMIEDVTEAVHQYESSPNAQHHLASQLHSNVTAQSRCELFDTYNINDEESGEQLQKLPLELLNSLERDLNTNIQGDTIQLKQSNHVQSPVNPKQLLQKNARHNSSSSIQSSILEDHSLNSKTSNLSVKLPISFTKANSTPNDIESNVFETLARDTLHITTRNSLQVNNNDPTIRRNTLNISNGKAYGASSLNSDLLSETESLRRRLEELDLSLKRIGSTESFFSSESVPAPHSPDFTSPDDHVTNR